MSNTTYRNKIAMEAAEAVAKLDSAINNINYLMRFSTLTEGQARALEETCEEVDRLILRIKIYATMEKITGVR